MIAKVICTLTITYKYYLYEEYTRILWPNITFQVFTGTNKFCCNNNNLLKIN